MVENFSFIKLSDKHADDIANLHLKAFPGFFLSKLGLKFLFTFYKLILLSENSVGVGLLINDKLIGFAIGAQKADSFYLKLFKKHFFELAFQTIIPIFKNPLIIKDLLSSFFSKQNSLDNYNNSAILLSICVDPLNESKGLGKNLLIQFEKVIYEYNNSIILATDAENNSYVNNFYVNNNFQLISTFFKGKRKMNFYFKSIKNK